MEHEDNEWQEVYRFDATWTPEPPEEPNLKETILQMAFAGVVFVLSVTLIGYIIANVRY